MDSKLTTLADARRRLNNSADGVASVREYLTMHTGPDDKAANDAIEYLLQMERGLRRVKLPGEV